MIITLWIMAGLIALIFVLLCLVMNYIDNQINICDITINDLNKKLEKTDKLINRVMNYMDLEKSYYIYPDTDEYYIKSTSNNKLQILIDYLGLQFKDIPAQNGRVEIIKKEINK